MIINNSTKFILRKRICEWEKMIIIRRLCSNRYSIFCKKEIDGFIWNFKSIWRDWVIHICYGAQSSSPRISLFQCLCWISHYVFTNFLLTRERINQHILSLTCQYAIVNICSRYVNRSERCWRFKFLNTQYIYNISYCSSLLRMFNRNVLFQESVNVWYNN